MSTPPPTDSELLHSIAVFASHFNTLESTWANRDELRAELHELYQQKISLIDLLTEATEKLSFVTDSYEIALVYGDEEDVEVGRRTIQDWKQKETMLSGELVDVREEIEKIEKDLEAAAEYFDG